ncbi:hypothetical protein C0991_000491 [Blastosporella zonata]|nr:hypothetical protein C0991_000491 [Blastosporella zonata]
MFSQRTPYPLDGILGASLAAAAVWLFYSFHTKARPRKLNASSLVSADTDNVLTASRLQGDTLEHDDTQSDTTFASDVAVLDSDDDGSHKKELLALSDSRPPSPPPTAEHTPPAPLQVPAVEEPEYLVVDHDADNNSSSLPHNDQLPLKSFTGPSVLYPSINERYKIILTFRSDPFDTAENKYDEVCLELARFPIKDTFKITVRMLTDQHWCEKGLQEIGQGLARLAKADVGKVYRCNWLSVFLPTSKRLPVGTAAGTVLALPVLKRLYWSSHRNQLPLLSPETSFSNITSLSLRCNISTQDCAFLLMKGAATLTTVNIWNLFDDASKSVLPHPAIDPSEPVTMSSLTFMTISSTSNLGPMLNQFEFPRLQKVNFDISVYIPHFKHDFQTIPWGSLQETWLKCDFSRDDPKWIEACTERANPRGYHNHVHRHFPTEMRSYIPEMED